MRSGITYRWKAFVVVLGASVGLAIANAFRALHAPFAVEIAQVVVFAVLIAMALDPVIAMNSSGPRRDRKQILPLFGLVALCAIAVLFVFALLASSHAAVHVFFPVLFPCLTLLVGDRLLAAGGVKIVQTLIGPATRALIVVCISLAFIAANFALSGMITRMAMLTSGANVAAIVALSCDLFLKLAPFVLYAVTLRESFQLHGDPSQTTENG